MGGSHSLVPCWVSMRGPEVGSEDFVPRLGPKVGTKPMGLKVASQVQWLGLKIGSTGWIPMLYPKVWSQGWIKKSGLKVGFKVLIPKLGPTVRYYYSLLIVAASESWRWPCFLCFLLVCFF